MFSVVLATHNEAAHLSRCLDSIKDLADEIIVADGESTDETVKIAHQYQARVISTTNKANFHINKQLAMDTARGDLVLQLDGDEVVDSELHAFIEKLVKLFSQSTQQNLDERAQLPSAWWLKRRNWFMGRFLQKGGQYPDPVIRLYQKGRARLPQKDVHEQMTADGEIGWASGHLLHYSNPTFADYLRKFNTYTSFKAQQLADQALPMNFWNTVNYLMLKPVVTFFSLYLRHRGYVDGVPGLTFAFFSGLHHAVAYMKYWEIGEKKRLKTRALKEKK